MTTYTPNQYKKAVELLFHWQTSNGDNMGSLVYKMIAKSDAENRRRMMKGFPEYVAAYDAWYSHKQPEQFFAEHGLGVLADGN